VGEFGQTVGITSNVALNVCYILEFSLFKGEFGKIVGITSNVAVNVC
jgi:hypothetical protein